MKKILLKIAGVFLILIGIIGIFLPFLNGTLFIFLGLSLIAPRVADRWRHWVMRKLFKRKLVQLDAYKKYKAKLGFTTRHFPVTIHHSRELDSPAVAEAVREAIGPLTRFAYAHQVHGDRIVVLEDETLLKDSKAYCVGEADAILSSIPDLTLFAFSADCLTVFLVAGDWIGVVHAGWKGTKLEIAPKAFQLICEKSGVRPNQVEVLFGPSISKKYYEVGVEFEEYFPEFTEFKNGKRCFDLAQANRVQLSRMGANPLLLHSLEICTVGENNHFYSFRKEGASAGRMISYITKAL